MIVEAFHGARGVMNEGDAATGVTTSLLWGALVNEDGPVRRGERGGDVKRSGFDEGVEEWSSREGGIVRGEDNEFFP